MQQQLGSQVVAQIGYVGSKGTKLFQFLDINQPSQAQITAADLANGVSIYGVPRALSRISSISTRRSHRPIPSTTRCRRAWHQQMARFVPRRPILFGRIRLTRQRSRGLRAQRGSAAEQHIPAGDRGNSSFDIRRRFTWNFVYQFPKGDGNGEAHERMGIRRNTQSAGWSALAPQL